MKYISEKEKKLEDALKKLKKLDLKNDQISGDIKESVSYTNLRPNETPEHLV